MHVYINKRNIGEIAPHHTHTLEANANPETIYRLSPVECESTSDTNEVHGGTSVLLLKHVHEHVQAHWRHSLWHHTIRNRYFISSKISNAYMHQ